MKHSKKDMDLVWKHTHADFKGVTEGTRMVMYPAPYFGLGTLEDYPEDAFKDKLLYAQRKEKWLAISSKLRNLAKKYGVLIEFESTEQWRESRNDVETFFSCILSKSRLNDFMADVDAAEIQWLK